MLQSVPFYLERPALGPQPRPDVGISPTNDPRPRLPCPHPRRRAARARRANAQVGAAGDGQDGAELDSERRHDSITPALRPPGSLGAAERNLQPCRNPPSTTPP